MQGEIQEDEPSGFLLPVQLLQGFATQPQDQDLPSQQHGQCASCQADEPPQAEEELLQTYEGQVIADDLVYTPIQIKSAFSGFSSSA